MIRAEPVEILVIFLALILFLIPSIAATIYAQRTGNHFWAAMTIGTSLVFGFGMPIFLIAWMHARRADSPYNWQSQYKVPQMTCDICQIKQPVKALRECTKCDKHFCYYPVWKSPRQAYLEAGENAGLGILVIGTAISIIGGIVLVMLLYIPFKLIHNLIPITSSPPYWRRCSSPINIECKECWQLQEKSRNISKTSPSASPPSSYSRTEYQNVYVERTYTQDNNDDYYDDEDYYDYKEYEDDDDDDDDDDGSIWDGWLVKW